MVLKLFSQVPGNCSLILQETGSFELLFFKIYPTSAGEPFRDMKLSFENLNSTLGKTAIGSYRSPLTGSTKRFCRGRLIKKSSPSIFTKKVASNEGSFSALPISV